MQKRYWIYMMEIKANILYLDIYVDYAYKRDIIIKAVCALATSGSIAAWAIWKKFAVAWFIITAVSQVLTVVKGYLPYEIMLKSIASVEKDLKLLYNKIEENWIKVASGKLEEEEINGLLYDFQNRYIKIEEKIFRKRVPLFKKRIEKKAIKQAKIYFEKHFNDVYMTHDNGRNEGEDQI